MVHLPAGRQAQCGANKAFSHFRVLASMAYRLIGESSWTVQKSGYNDDTQQSKESKDGQETNVSGRIAGREALGRIALSVWIGMLFAGSYAAQRALTSTTRPGAVLSAESLAARPVDAARLDGLRCRRIVSLAPSITETLFALGLGDRVVGVTTYCDYPAEAQAKPRVGDYFRPNYEAVVARRPDLVITLAEDSAAHAALTSLGIDVLKVDHRTIGGILESIDTIGRVCGRQREAREMRAGMEERIRRVREMAAGRRPHRVMISIGRTFGGEAITKTCIAGQDGFYSAMLEIAGQQNVYRDAAIKFPEISAEGILALNPEVIIELIPYPVDEARRREIRDEWNALGRVRAVRDGRVYVLAGEHLVRPGPRMVQTLEDIASAIFAEGERLQLCPTP